MRARSTAGMWTLVAVGAVLACGLGCTMCPDPFDYSGPVPNGSAPQNDFRARSNGILPLGAAPHPFPPVVRAAPLGGDGDTVPAEPLAEDPDTAVRPVAAEVIAAGDSDG